MANNGFGSTVQQSPSVKNRRTRVRFDVPVSITKEPLFAMTRTMEQIAPLKDPSTRENVHLVPGIGWELKPFQMDGSHKQERAEVSGSFLRVGLLPGQMQIADTFEEGPGWRQETYTGVTYDAGVTSGQTDYYISRAVLAGASFGAIGAAMTASQTAIPGPTEETQNTSVDRIAVSNSKYTQNDPVFFEWYSSGSDFDTPDILKKFYFAGPAGTLDNDNANYGEYCLSITGDGYAILSSRWYSYIASGYVWKQVDKWRYCPQHQAMAHMHRVYVRCNHYDSRTDGAGTICFVFTSGDVSSSSLTIAATGAVSPNDRVTNRHKVVIPRYKPTAPKGKKVPLGKSALMIDVRRDQFPYVQPTLACYHATGVIRDGNFKLGTLPSNTTVPIRALWFGHVPAGCSVSIALYDALTDTALALAGPLISFPGGGGYDFTLPAWADVPHLEFYAKVTLNGGANKTPTVVQLRYQRDGVVTTSDPALVPEFNSDDDVAAVHIKNKVLLQVSTTGGEADPTHSSANVVIHDLVNDLYKLRARGSFPGIIETRYDTDPTHWSRLAQGYFVDIEAQRRGSNAPRAFGADPAVFPANFPSKNWHSYDLTMLGMWRRLKRIRLPYSVDLTRIENGKPRATTIIRALFNAMGVSDTQLDIQDIPIYIWAGAYADSPVLQVPALTDLFSLAQKIARDYLLSFIYHDDNAGTNGMWRLSVPPTAPYHNLLDIVTTGPAGFSRLPHMDVSYDFTTEGSQVVQKTYVLKGTLQQKTVEPAYNMICVTSTPNLLQGFEERQTVYMYNWKSARFFDDQPEDPDPDDPDFIGEVVPLFIYHPNLADPEAAEPGAGVRWMCRVAFDRFCHGYQAMNLITPLPLLTDVRDTLQTRPRPPRYQDAVRLNGVQFVTRNCNAIIRKDAHQRCYWELETPRGI